MPSATHVSVDGHDSVSLAPWQTVVVVVEQWNFVVQIFTPPAHSPVGLAHASPTSGRLPSSIRPLQSLSLPSQISTPPFVGTQALPLPLPSPVLPPSLASPPPPPSPWPPSPLRHSRQ